MGDDDLLAQPYAAQEVREEVARVPRVVFGEQAWLGVASWRGVATSETKPLQHAVNGSVETSTKACRMRGDFVKSLAAADIGATFNQYAASPLLQERLRTYLSERASAKVVLVGEAAGYRGARVSGIPFTSERQLAGAGPAEATATIVHRVLATLGVEDDVLLWNVVPTHPGSEKSNRPPTRAEVEAAAPFLDELTRGRVAIAVGRLAATVLDAPYVRHPSHGGAAAFEAGLRRSFATIGRRRTAVRLFS